MNRLALAAVLLLGLGVEARGRTVDRPANRSSARVSAKSIMAASSAEPFIIDTPPPVPSAPADIWAFATGTGGIPSIPSDVCSGFSSELTGTRSFCMRGDGTMSGNQAFTTGGTPGPTTENRQFCGNGADCGTMDFQRLNGNGYRRSSVTPSAMLTAQGDFTILTCFIPNAINNSIIGYRATGTSAGASLTMGSGVINANVYNSAGTATTISAPLQIGQAACVALVYGRVGAGTSTLDLYVNSFSGSVAASSTVAVDVGAPSDGHWRIGSLMASGSGQNGLFWFGAMTEKKMTGTAIGTWTTNAFGGPVTETVANAALTYSGTAYTACSNGQVTTNLPPGRPCFVGGKLVIPAAATNLVSQSSAVQPASGNWTATNATVTANTTEVVAPDGTYSADKVAYNATNAGSNVAVINNATGLRSAGSYTQSYKARSASASGTLYSYVSQGGSHRAVTACNVVNTKWTQCFGTGSNFTSENGWLNIGVDAANVAMTGQPAQTIYIAEVQDEIGAIATAHIPTYGSTVARTSARLSASAFPGTLSKTEGCSRLCVTPTWSGAPPASRIPFTFGGTENRVLEVLNTDAAAARATRVGAASSTGTTVPAGTASFFASGNVKEWLAINACGATGYGNCPAKTGNVAPTDADMYTNSGGLPKHGHYSTAITASPLTCAAPDAFGCRFTLSTIDGVANTLTTKLDVANDVAASSGRRNEIQLPTDTPSGYIDEGEEAFYRFETKIPTDGSWPNPSSTGGDTNWAVLWQVHHEGSNCSPPIELGVHRTDVIGGSNMKGTAWQYQFSARDNYGGQPTGGSGWDPVFNFYGHSWPAAQTNTPVSTGTAAWASWLIHVKWSRTRCQNGTAPTGGVHNASGSLTSISEQCDPANPNGGMVEVFKDGVLVYAGAHRTMWNYEDAAGTVCADTGGTGKMKNYIKMGLYMDPRIATNTNGTSRYATPKFTVHHRNVKTGTTCASVWNQAGNPCGRAAGAASTSSVVAASWVPGVEQCFRTTWSAAANQFRVENLTTGVMGNAMPFTALWATSPNSISLGSDETLSTTGGMSISSMRIGPSALGCK